MPFHPLPAHETERVAKLRSYRILDSMPEESYDRIARLAAQMFDVSVAVVSLIEDKRQWFKAQVGASTTEVERRFTFCSHVICQDDVFVVEDALEDERFADNPFVTNEPYLRFYAGAPLRASGGHNLGTVAIIDSKPRSFSEADRRSLADLAAMVIDALEMRLVINRADAAERRFVDAMESLPNGFVLYDKDDRLVYCNERYREIYAESAAFIVPGADFEDIIRKGVENGQHPEAIGDEEAWIDKRLDLHLNPAGPIEQQLPGDKWLRVEERRTSEGGIVGFRFDVTTLKRQERDLARLAWTDSLTDAMNRHRFMELSSNEIDKARRHGGNLSLLLLDVDHFKKVNDRNGHAAGDLVLKQLVERWKGVIRSHDVIGRIGGEEFGVLLPETDAQGAIRNAEKLRATIADLPFAYEGQLLRITISVGVATFAPGDDLAALIRRADDALYEAKHAGRDRCMVGTG